MDDVWTKLVALAGQTDIGVLSLSDLAARLGLTHRSQAKHYKDKALKDGLLLRSKAGRIVPAPSADNPSLITLPIIGEANCGPATIVAQDQISGTVSFSPSVLKQHLGKGAFAVKAVGDSMNQADINGKAIEDGDLAIVEPVAWSNAADGEYVLSVIDGMANIKRLHIDQPNRRIILRSESLGDLFEDIILQAEDLYMYVLSGRVVDVIKGVS